MTQGTPPSRYVLDPADPRAPTQEQWDAMSRAERDAVIAALPTSLPIDVAPPEGDHHRKAKEGALDSLDDFFRRSGKRIYLSSELATFYPGEPTFVPDVLAVLDVEAHDRTRWVVTEEGKGLDLVIEVLYAGDPRKDLELNVERYGRLGISEYFVFDRRTPRLFGYAQAAAGGRGFRRMVPQAGRFPSKVLGLELALDGQRLRFFSGNAPLEDTYERIARLGSMVDDVLAREEAAERRANEALAREEEVRARAEEERARADALAKEVEALRAELARLKS